jgi:hypothetical protein
MTATADLLERRSLFDDDIVLPYLFDFATPEQCKRWLPKMTTAPPARTPEHRRHRLRGRPCGAFLDAGLPYGAEGIRPAHRAVPEHPVRRCRDAD